MYALSIPNKSSAGCLRKYPRWPPTTVVANGSYLVLEYQ